MLELDAISRAFAVRRGLFDVRPASFRAVDNVSLTLENGETLGLVGESGCGKSTLARLAAGLLAPSGGEARVDGRPLAAWNRVERARRVQMVFQDPFSSFNPRRTVGASVAEPLLLTSRTGRRSLAGEVARALADVGLDPAVARRYPHEFSGGQRQRLAVARALIARPKLLICDEPVSALDASVQAQTLNLLKDQKEARQGLTCLFISHDLGVVGFMADRVAVMYLGRIVELAPREALFTAPAHPYAEALLAAVPDPSGRKERAALAGEPPSPLDPPPGCPFHPRCPYAQDLCRHTDPQPETRGPGHWARCHFPRG